MDRISKLVQHELFITSFQLIQQEEKQRIFCKHGMEHSLDVARIAYILNLENGYNVSKDIIYATALLHDIGRSKQYTSDVNHNEAGALLAKKILTDIGFEDDQIEMMIQAILHHRKNNKDNDKLSMIIYQGDKLSRMCFHCEAYRDCYWNEEQKNKSILY